MRRGNEVVREAVAEAVGTLKDPRIGLITITGVDVSPDLRDAKVFVSVFGNEKKRKATMAALDAAHGVLQTRVARGLTLKRTPHLSFEYDPTVEHGIRMTKLIDELVHDLPDDDGE